MSESRSSSASISQHKVTYNQWIVNNYSIKNQWIQKTQNITWNIDHRLKQQMKNANNNTIFRSDDIESDVSDDDDATATPTTRDDDHSNDNNKNNEDAMFVIVGNAAKPNIYSYPDIQFYIAMKNDLDCLSMDQITVKFTMLCWQLNINQTWTTRFDQKHTDSHKYHNNSNRLALRKCDAESLTITAKIELQIESIDDDDESRDNGANTIDKQWDPEQHNIQYEAFKSRSVAMAYINDRFYNISDDIKDLCLLYVGEANVIQNTTNIEWILDNDALLDAMLSPSNRCGMQCSSHVVHSCSMDWQCSLYSNGKTTDNIGTCILTLRLRSMPAEWHECLLCVTVECGETMTKHTNINTFNDADKGEYDVIGLITRDEMRSLHAQSNQITFKICIEILKIHAEDECIYDIKLSQYAQNQSIEWKVCRQRMKMMKKWDVLNSGMQKRFECSNYDDVAGVKRLWCVRCNPCNSDDNTQIDLQMISMPSHIERLRVKYRIYCIGDDGRIMAEYCDYHVFAVASGQASTEAKQEHCCVPFNTLANTEQIVFGADVQIMNEYDAQWKDITSDEIAAQWMHHKHKWKHMTFEHEYPWQMKLMLSDVFEVGKLRFVMELNNNNGIGLRLCTMPSQWERGVYVSVMMQCNEHRLCVVAQFDSGHDEVKIYSASDIKRIDDFNELSVRIVLLAVDDLYQIPFHKYKRQERVEWCVEMCNIGDVATNASGMNMWVLAVVSDASGVKIGVQLRVLPFNVSKVMVQITFHCDCDCVVDDMTKNIEFDYDDSCSDLFDVLTMEQVKNMERVTFCADIVVLNEYTADGDEVTADNIESDLFMRSKYVVSGFIRRYVECDEIASVCGSYVADLFMMNYGEYRWNINDIVNPNESNAFYRAQLPWKMTLYPNERFEVGLTLLTMPKSWQNISVALEITCVQTRSYQRQIVQYTKERKTNYWRNGVLQRKKVVELKLECLTFVICVHILRIRCTDHTLFYQAKLSTSYSKNTQIKWNIDKKLMNQMKEFDHGESLISNVYDELWYLQCFPNGADNVIKGDVVLGLGLYSLPQHISKLRVQCKLFCVESNVMDHQIREFSFVEGETLHCWKSNTFSLSNFNSYEGLTFCADIAIILEYGIDGKGRALQQVKQQSDTEMRHQIELLKEEIVEINRKVSQLTDTVQMLLYSKDKIDEPHVQNEEQQKLYEWLCKTAKLEQYYHIFVNNGFDDITVLKDISINELQQIGIHKLGHRKKLLKLLASISSHGSL